MYYKSKLWFTFFPGCTRMLTLQMKCMNRPVHPWTRLKVIWVLMETQCICKMQMSLYLGLCICDQITQRQILILGVNWVKCILYVNKPVTNSLFQEETHSIRNLTPSPLETQRKYSQVQVFQCSSPSVILFYFFKGREKKVINYEKSGTGCKEK